MELQLIRKPKNQVVDLALKIIKNHFEQFSKKHFEKIKTKLNIDEDLLKRSIKEIEKLNPRPGGSHNENNKLNSSIVPDFLDEPWPFLIKL